MSPETQEPSTIQPVRDRDGNIIPGLFAFDSLPRNKAVESDIAQFIHDNELQEKLQEIDEFVKP